ncbi:hypothetical protein OsJ_17718 [Oryza sativa Japonica Group]|uniref:RNase H type-1 domain-containing protein n=1 Tax=Oryza sativa subsp. japonica TaxID=39947 RepID=B9FND6_ORYSJ|nr:hypothetical protein OsJ_17718 [Oryza sativa Japonica Group]
MALAPVRLGSSRCCWRSSSVGSALCTNPTLSPMATPNNNVVAAMSGTKGGSGTPCSSDVAASPLVEEAAASAEMTAEAAAGGRSRTAKAFWAEGPGDWKGLTTGALGWGGANFWREKRCYSKTTGVGAILRDSAGKTIFASCKPIERCSEAPESEILAFVDGLSKAIQWTSLPIVVETDCLIVLHLLDSKEKDRSMFASIIQEAKALVVGGGREIVIRKIVCGFIDPK